jgi:hypothetical protein
MNKKYDQDFLVSARHSPIEFTARDFKLKTEPLDSGYRQLRSSSRQTISSEPRPISQSERDSPTDAHHSREQEAPTSKSRFRRSIPGCRKGAV